MLLPVTCSVESWSVRCLQGLQRIFCMAKLTSQHLRTYKFCTFPFISWFGLEYSVVWLAKEFSGTQAYRGITRRTHHTDAYAQGGDTRYQQTEVFFMVVKDVDSVTICGAVLAQMLKGEKHFANTVPRNTGLSNQSYCSHFQSKTGHFCHLNFYFFCVVSVNFNRLVKFLSIYIFNFFLYKITIFTPLTIH